MVEGKISEYEERRFHPIQLCGTGQHHGDRGVSFTVTLISHQLSEYSITTRKKTFLGSQKLIASKD